MNLISTLPSATNPCQEGRVTLQFAELVKYALAIHFQFQVRKLILQIFFLRDFERSFATTLLAELRRGS